MSSATSAARAGSGTARRSKRRRACSMTSSPRTGRCTRKAPPFRTARTSTRWTTRSRGARGRKSISSKAGRVRGCISSSSTRRATTSTGTAWRWTASCPTAPACRSKRAHASRASTRSCARRIVRTSSCRLGGTARSRSLSSKANCWGQTHGSDPGLSLAEEGFRHGEPVLGDRLQLRRGFLQRHVDDAVAMQGGHPPELLLLDEVGGLEAVARGENAIAGGRRAAALHMSEHSHPRLVTGPPLDLLRECGADSAFRQAGVSELVDVVGAAVGRALQLVAFRDDDDREVLAPLVSTPDVVARL